jgi:hypothetical protein
MTTAPELDPYLLPMPTPATPVVSDDRVAAVHAHLNACFSSSVWPLAPLSENPSGKTPKIYWRNCPAVFQDEIRLVAWTMINGQLRPTFLRERGNQLRGRLSADRTADTVTKWMNLTIWLETHGITTLADCDSSVLHEYGQHLLGEHRSRGTVKHILGAMTRLWAFDQLSARPTGIGRPPWDELGADDYLPAATSSGGENITEPLAEGTMGPLLVWAIRMVDDFADDIFAAWAETQRLSAIARTATSSPQSLAALHAFIAPLIARREPLPSVQNQGKTRVARIYISGLTGASDHQVGHLIRRMGLRTVVTERSGPCPLDAPVTGVIGGKPWREKLDFTETAGLMRHLGTAAFIILSYLTGMRPGENGAELHLIQHSAGSK